MEAPSQVYASHANANRMVLQLGLQLVLPLFLLIDLWRGRFHRRWTWLLNVLAVGAVLVFLFLTARWDLTSYYLRYIWPLLLIIVAFRSYPRASEPADDLPLKTGSLIVNAVLLLVFGGLSMVVLRGHLAPDEAIQLAAPLRGHTYYVGGGGNSRLINNHQAVESQQFALDIVRLNRFGNRATGLTPDDPERYAIFGDTVYSPCSGRVIEAVDGFPDLRPPERDPVNLAGNHVVLDCEEVRVLLAHLKQGSVAVTSGLSVREGEILGQVGNSGNTSQPHLHLHAERGGELGSILTGIGMPFTVDDRFLVRNSVFRGGPAQE